MTFKTPTHISDLHVIKNHISILKAIFLIFNHFRLCVAFPLDQILW